MVYFMFYRMSAEDLETYHVDVERRSQFLAPRASLGDGLNHFLQKSKGILRGASLPSLLDTKTLPNEEEEKDSEAHLINNHRGEKLVTIEIKQND